MHRKMLFNLLIGLLALISLQPTKVRGASPNGLLTAREQSQVLQIIGFRGVDVGEASRANSSQIQFLSDLEKNIRQANPGMDSQSLRHPVSKPALRNLQLRSFVRGNMLSLNEMRATTDYAHALLIESNGKKSLFEKVKTLPEQNRNAFHGKVAELTEARARGLVLNKNPFGTTFDLTEAKFRPRSYQLKIFASPSKALNEMLYDLHPDLKFNKRGIMTKDTLVRLEQSGKLVRNGNVYQPIGRDDVKLEASKVFSRPAESHIYAKTGRESLLRRGLTNGKTVPTGFQSSGKWLGRAGLVASLALEGYVIQGYASGRLSEREFVTAQAGIAGGVGGALAGAKAGAIIGVIIVGGPENPAALISGSIGAAVGGIAGGIGGAKMGEAAAYSFYSRLDGKQKQNVETFIYQHYANRI